LGQSGSGSTATGWGRCGCCWGGGCGRRWGSTGANFDGIEATWLGTLGTGTFAVWLLDGDADLALVEKLRAVGIFVDVRLLASGQICGIFQVVQQEFVQCASLLVENLHGVTIAIVNNATVHNGTESVHSLGVAGPFVVNLLANGGKLNGLASGTAFQNLQICGVNLKSLLD
jgi:hypothetical protein